MNLTTAQLEKRISLSEKPTPVILKGQFVKLKPLVVMRDSSLLLS